MAVVVRSFILSIALLTIAEQGTIRVVDERLDQYNKGQRQHTPQVVTIQDIARPKEVETRK
jgi:hypothetical protein